MFYQVRESRWYDTVRPVCSGHTIQRTTGIVDTFLRNRPNLGQTLIEKRPCSGHFYSGHVL